MKRLYILTLLVFVAAAASAQTKKVSILGDSYSTFQGYNPDNYRPFYPDANNDVKEVEQTWWSLYIQAKGYELDKNNSWGATTICGTGFFGRDVTPSCFLSRVFMLGDPDIIFVFGATNDSWAGVPVGEPQSGDLFTYSPALDRLLADAKDRYPNVQIYFLLNDGLREDITRATITSCEAHQIPCIQLHDIHKKSGHPSVAGMQSIAEQVLSFISSPTVGSFPSEK